MKGLCLIIWMILTLVLVASVIGLLLIMPEKYEVGAQKPSSWMQMGMKLLDSVIE